MELDIPMLNNIADALDMAICEMESHFDLLNDDNIHYPYTLKHTITNLTSSVELLIKFRLMQEHWAFIFSDINRATIEKLETGDFISVDFTTGIERLKNICELNNSFIECHKLRNMRNRIEHYTLTDSVERILKIIADSIYEIKSFLELEIIEYLPDAAREEFRSKINCINELADKISGLEIFNAR